MRLLNLNTLELREFIDTERPPYVILSHTWGAEEVSLQELHGSNVTSREGYLKILNFAKNGKENGFEWGWADTCCIDKTSSAELSESINSMYRWYQEADSCYAYLVDVSGRAEFSIHAQFSSSRWFTRGWTLQELLAPSSVVFYLQDWTIGGTKSSLQDEISRITDIPTPALTRTGNLNLFTVAQKISWVSRRYTTRPEDLSYCLLGLLGVYMPLLYGEGARAFTRLQEEVMKIGTDATIFAWPSSALPPNTAAEVWRSPLAPSPAAFRDAGKHRVSAATTVPAYGPWSVTNRGIRIEGLRVFEDQSARVLLKSAGFRIIPNRTYAIALIGCYRALAENSVSGSDKQFGIALYKQGDIYYRFRAPESLLILDLDFDPKRLIIDLDWRTSARVDCLMQLEPVVITLDPSHPETQTTWVIRELPKGRSNLRVSQVSGSVPKGNGTFSIVEFDNLGYDASRPCYVQCVGFEHALNNGYISVLATVGHPLPSIYVIGSLMNHSPSQLLKVDSPAINALYANHLDQGFGELIDGRKVLARVVPGVEAGKRVFFLDISLLDEI